MNTTELVVEMRPEKNSGANGIWTHDFCDTGAKICKIFMLFSYFVYIAYFTKFTRESSLFMEKSLLVEKSKVEEKTGPKRKGRVLIC